MDDRTVSLDVRVAEVDVAAHDRLPPEDAARADAHDPTVRQVTRLQARDERSPHRSGRRGSNRARTVAVAGRKHDCCDRSRGEHGGADWGRPSARLHGVSTTFVASRLSKSR